jgi:ribonuclease BN (tRNA processing enzyme)
LNTIGNLRYLMIETTFLNHNDAGAEASGHMRTEPLAKGLKQLNKSLRVLITHMEPAMRKRQWQKFRQRQENSNRRD